MILRQARNRGETAMDELVKIYMLLREVLADRLDEVDTEAIRKRGAKTAAGVRQRVESRVRPKPRRRLPMGALLLLGAAVGVGFVLYDRRRRDMVAGRLTQARVRTQEKLNSAGVTGAVDNVMGRMRSGAQELDETRLRAEVDAAIRAGGELPPGLKITVEGRTVYLRGVVDEPSQVDQAAERAQQVPGVAAVVNLTSSPEPSPSPAPPNKPPA